MAVTPDKAVTSSSLLHTHEHRHLHETQFHVIWQQQCALLWRAQNQVKRYNPDIFLFTNSSLHNLLFGSLEKLVRAKL